jgi:hypothetical protein
LFKVKAEINQSISLDDKTIEDLKHVDGNVYLVNMNSGSVNTQVNFSDCLMDYYKQGIGLFAILEKVRRLYVNLALTDCKTKTEAARRLKVSPKTIWNHASEETKLIAMRGSE